MEVGRGRGEVTVWREGKGSVGVQREGKGWGESPEGGEGVEWESAGRECVFEEEDEDEGK